LIFCSSKVDLLVSQKYFWILNLCFLFGFLDKKEKYSNNLGNPKLSYDNHHQSLEELC
jgi:hypothetical protein